MTDHDDSMRVAVLSTPRSGNTWARRLLAHYFRLSEVAVHVPSDIREQEIAQRQILQIHWQPEASFRTFLGRQNFRPVVVTRHPLDVLISILHFAPNEPQTNRWLDGSGGSEDPIRGVTPCSEAFRQYATGPRAAELLSVSSNWARQNMAWRIDYEALVANPKAVLQALCLHLGQASDGQRWEEALEGCRMEKMRATSNNGHFWMGKPSLWKQFLPADLATEIYRAHRSIFDSLGYDCDADAALTSETATQNWRKVA